MHPSCADCLFNLGILYKQRGYAANAEEAFSQALYIRQECIGIQSLPTANVHEELGKFYIEQEDYQASYTQFKSCYDIRCKVLVNQKHADVERVATLLIFLHRKIEIQLVEYKEKEQSGQIKLLTDIGLNLQSSIGKINQSRGEGNVLGEDSSIDIFDESFAFLKPKKNDDMDDSNVSGNELLWEVFGKKSDVNSAITKARENQHELPNSAKMGFKL
jgi:tetratricopeptide (TPR) repeat protein